MSEHDMDLRKALDTLNTGTTGSPALIPELVSQGLRHFIIDQSPLYARVPKRPWDNNSYEYRAVTALPTATWGIETDSLPSVTTGTYAQPTVPMAYLYSTGEVTGPMIAASRSLLDALRVEIDLHAKAIVKKLEQTLVSGDRSSNAKEFSGFKKQIVTNEIDASNATLTLSILDQGIDKPQESPTDIVLDRAMSRRIWALLQAQQRFVDRTTIAGGFKVPVYQDLPIIRVNTDVTGMTTTILLPDMNYTTFLINKDLTYEPLGKGADTEKFFMTMYCTLAVEGEALYHGKISNVASS